MLHLGSALLALFILSLFLFLLLSSVTFPFVILVGLCTLEFETTGAHVMRLLLAWKSPRRTGSKWLVLH
jgi:hypothetical protein